MAVTELKTVESVANQLLPEARQDSLLAWFELYMSVEVGSPETNTFRAKKADLQNSSTTWLSQRGQITRTNGRNPLPSRF